jgi:thiamine transport system permease protein
LAWPTGGKAFLLSIGLGASGLVLALLLGFPVGVHLGRRGGGVVAALALVPLAFPPQVSAYVWRFILEDTARFVGGARASWGFFGAAWTLAATYWPLVAFPLAAGMRLRGSRLEQELATLAPARAVFWRAVVPGLLPTLVAGGGVFFLLSFSNFAVPLMWNLPAQTVAVFARLAAFYSPAEAAMVALPLQVTVLLVSGAGLWWLSRRPYGLDLGEAQVAERAGDVGGFRWEGVATVLVLLVTGAVPLAALVTGPGSLTMLRANLLAGASPYRWGLVLATLGATGALALGLVLALLARRCGRVFRGVVEVVGLVALFVPAAVVSLVLAGALEGPGWLSPLYDSLGVFPLAYGLRYFYIPYKTVGLVLRLEGREHGEVAKLLGLGLLRRLEVTVWGVLRPAVAVSWLVVFTLVLGELEIATFLAQPGRQPVSVYLDNLMHYGWSAAVTQWTLILVAGEVALAWATLALGWGQWRRLVART